MLENLIKRMYRWRSVILTFLLFCLSFGLPIFIAQVSLSTPIIRTEQNTSQLVKQGQESYQVGAFAESAQIWQEVAQAFAAQKDYLNQAMALSNLSLSNQQLGKWPSATEAITQSLNLLETVPKNPDTQRILASTLDIQGQLQLAVGQPQSALKTWQKAAEIYSKLGDQNGRLGSRINQAQALQDLGLYPRACQTLLDALEMEHLDCQISPSTLQTLKQESLLSLQVLGLRSLGNVLRVIGQPEQSQLALLKSWQLAQQIKDYRNLGAIYLSLGNTARALGNKKLPLQDKSVFSAPEVACIQGKTNGTAIELYQQAIDCYHQATLTASPTIKIQAQLNLLSLSIEQGLEIPLRLPELQSQINLLPTSRTAIFAQLKLAQGLMCLQTKLSQEKSQFLSPILQSCSPVGTKIATNPNYLSNIPSLSEINQGVTAALQSAQILGDKQAEANALGYLGALAQQMRDYSQAQQFTQSALQRISAFDTPELAYLWQWQLGRLYQIKRKPTEAIAAYTLSFQILKSLRRDLIVTNPDVQFTFRDSVEPVYRELVDLLLQSENPSRESLQQARDIIESLQVATLNNFFREACLETSPQEIDQLDPQAAVIYSIILPKRLAVILSIPGSPLKYYSTETVKGAQVERVFDELLATLNPFVSQPEALRPNQQFYDWLIRPAKAELEKSGIKTLVFVLDGVLRGVPLSVLHDGEQYLIEKYNLALTPGLQLFNPRRIASEKLKVLVGGLTEGRQGFSPLPSVEKEVKKIAEIASTDIILNEQFTRTGLETRIQSNEFPIVHLATHGQFSSQAEDTFLVTWDELVNVQNLDQLLRKQNQFKTRTIELLILSACQTALGDNRAALGLAGVAVRSGASSTLATLWSIQDQSTAELMTQFYEVLNQPNVNKAEALRQAQLSLLHSPQYQHPFYWAAFVLVGSWL